MKNTYTTRLATKTTLVIFAITLIAALYNKAAHAASELPAKEYKQIYLANGKQVPSEQAILAALNGQEVFKCTTVEAKVSNAGTSIGVKNVKKPRASK